jgi:hypothetical protein
VSAFFPRMDRVEVSLAPLLRLCSLASLDSPFVCIVLILLLLLSNKCFYLTSLSHKTATGWTNEPTLVINPKQKTQSTIKTQNTHRGKIPHKPHTQQNPANNTRNKSLTMLIPHISISQNGNEPIP